MLPHHQFGHSEGTLPNHRPYSLYELPDDYIGRTELRLFDDGTSENKRQTPDLISNQTKFEQLARLHEMYKTKLARANVTKALSSNLSPSLQYRPPSRCQSLSMSDMLYGSGNPDSNYTSVVAGAGGGSIYSEPAYNVHNSLRQNQAKICDNCKMSFSHTGNGSSWYQPLMTKTTWEHIPMHHPLGSMVCDSVNHRFCSKYLFIYVMCNYRTLTPVTSFVGVMMSRRCQHGRGTCCVVAGKRTQVIQHVTWSSHCPSYLAPLIVHIFL